MDDMHIARIPLEKQGSVVEAQNKVYHACVAKLVPGAAPCDYKIDTSQLITRELVLAFALLAVVALIPVALKKWSMRNAAA